MNAHYTTFEGKKQFDVLREKANLLGRVVNFWPRDNYFGYNINIQTFIPYEFLEGMVMSAYYQEATYLPYNEYLDYLDRCIKDKDNG